MSGCEVVSRILTQSCTGKAEVSIHPILMLIFLPALHSSLCALRGCELQRTGREDNLTKDGMGDVEPCAFGASHT